MDESELQRIEERWNATADRRGFLTIGDRDVKDLISEVRRQRAEIEGLKRVHQPHQNASITVDANGCVIQSWPGAESI